jgi:hypothetical protein
MKLTWKHLTALSYLRYAESFLDASAAAFPHGSRLQRASAMGSQLVRGMDGLTGLALRNMKDGHHSYTNRLLRKGIERYGQHVARVNEGSWIGSATDVYVINDHIAHWSIGGDNETFCTDATLEQIGEAVLAAALVDLGTDTRAAVTEDGLVADTEQAPERMTSDVAQLCASLRIELAHGHRSVLLWGPGGSGKTAASRQLVAELSPSTMVVTSEALSYNVFSLLCSWRPKAVILDDIDRGLATLGEAELLGGLSRLRAVVPLVIATANVQDEFSGALLRPQRFDRIEHFARLDADVARSMIPNVPLPTRERAVESGLLPSYLVELDFRVRCGSNPEATLDEMITRQEKAGDGLHSINGNKTERPQVGLAKVSRRPTVYG